MTPKPGKKYCHTKGNLRCATQKRPAAPFSGVAGPFYSCTTVPIILTMKYKYIFPFSEFSLSYFLLYTFS